MASQPTTAPELVTFAAPDGIAIACYRSGSGPALVAVHGTAADHSAWDAVAPLLARQFTVYAMDRRGRGQSGDSPDYSLEREIADVIAVVAGIGQPVHLYGHSFGGTPALEAAFRHPASLASLTLYEGGLKPAGVAFFPEGVIAHLEVLIGEGRREEALVSFMSGSAGLTPAELAVLQASPSWAARVAAVHTIPRELRAVDAYSTDVSRLPALRLPALRLPVLLLRGEKTEERRRQLFAAMGQHIPGARLVDLPGQGHAAHQTAPGLLADTLAGFLASVGSGR